MNHCLTLLTSFIFPYCVAEELYKPGYLAGARVSSNSWGNPYGGGASGGYYASQDTDLYLFKRPVCTIVICNFKLYAM